jgi:hypothetical protein
VGTQGETRSPLLIIHIDPLLIITMCDGWHEHRTLSSLELVAPTLHLKGARWHRHF